MSSHNDMGQWNGKDAQDAAHQAAARARPDQVYSSGVFMIVIGTSSYLQEMVKLSGDAAVTCSQGKTLLVAQLKYNNGNSINLWSQDAICIAPTDSFSIEVSSQIDHRMVAAGHKIIMDREGINWMQDAGPAENYQQAAKSPRSIRLVLENQGMQVITNPGSLKSN